MVKLIKPYNFRAWDRLTLVQVVESRFDFAVEFCFSIQNCLGWVMDILEVFNGLVSHDFLYFQHILLSDL